MNRTTIAVDLAKSVFQVAVADSDWRVVSRQRLSRGQLLRFFSERQPCLVVMEACGTAHFWGRWLSSLGFTVRLLPQYVRAFVCRNKTDRSDAEALLEAARSTDLTAVAVKSEQQQALLSLHRPRPAWLASRTARLNTVRGILREFGVNIPRGARRVTAAVETLRGVHIRGVRRVGRMTIRGICDCHHGFARSSRSKPSSEGVLVHKSRGPSRSQIDEELTWVGLPFDVTTFELAPSVAIGQRKLVSHGKSQE